MIPPVGQKNNVMCGYLEKPDRFTDFVNGSLYQGREVIRPEQVQECQSVYSRQNRARDILRKVCRGGSYLLIGVENQEMIHYAMPVRCMEYDVLEYKRQLRTLQAKYRGEKAGLSGAEFLSGMKKNDRLSPVITIVFYHGTEEYDGCRTLEDMLNWDKENEIFRRYIADYHINLVTLSELEEENFRTGVRELVGFLKRRKSKRELERYCADNEKRIRGLDEDTFEAISVMIDQPQMARRKDRYRKGDRVDMCKAMEDWREELLNEGIGRGLEQGIRALILDNQSEGRSPARILEKLQRIFSLDEEAARGYLGKYGGQQTDMP